MGPAGALCRACATELRHGARFCDSCGAPAPETRIQPEFKQVTVLFADVVNSLTMASVLGAERLREIMADVFGCAAKITRRYGGTVDKFTGDGIMALFGAPVALEDHAFRACLAALDIQEQIAQLADEVQRRDGIPLALRVGLNSGQVIAGEISSDARDYTAVGEQVGLAQRMESVAPLGGVMLSESTARLVEHATVLGAPEWVNIKGAQAPLPARRLLGTATERVGVSRREPTLVGRTWEMNSVAGILERAIGGAGSVIGVVGPPGIGKSRIAGEAVTMASARGFEVFTVSCESHTREVPFRVVSRLLKTVFGVSDLDEQAGRARVRARIPNADAEDLLLLDDLLGIGVPDAVPPTITADARRRRLAALLNAAALTRTTPVQYVIEDLHWIDEVSEAMLAELVSVVPQIPALMVLTYRPEYRGALSRTPGAQTISLAPLNSAQTTALTTELLGKDPSVRTLGARIAERAAGNPFFAEEMVRDLAQRGVLDGDRGAFICREDIADVSVPATLQATIAARIDRLGRPAKQVLYAAAVIGAQFRSEFVAALLDDVEVDAAITELLQVELIDQVMFTPRAGYAFRHPLIRTVAYESQLKSGRAVLHQRLATAIEEQDPGGADEHAALIAENLEAAGDLRAAFDWHMRAGGWSAFRDIRAARTNWQRARQVADRLPADATDRASLQIAPRNLLCGTLWRAGGSIADTGFDELRNLCTAIDDKVSLAIGMTGFIMALTFHNRFTEAAQLASEQSELLESIGDPTLTVALLFAAIYAKCEAGEMVEALRLSNRLIDLADGDPIKGNLIFGSPLSTAMAMRGHVKMCLGIRGWLDDATASIEMAAPLDKTSYVFALLWKYVASIPFGALPADTTATRETAEALRIAESSSDDFILGMGLLSRGLVLAGRGGAQRMAALDHFTQARNMALAQRFSLSPLIIVDPDFAMEKARTGDLDGAVDMVRARLDGAYVSGDMIWRGRATEVLVQLLIERGSDGDREQAQAAIDRLAAVPVDPGFVLHELPILRSRALLALAQGDENSSRDLLEQHRARAAAVGYIALINPEETNSVVPQDNSMAQ
jgi:adenylate cyclase